MTINGFALLVFFGATLIVGVVCYAWGYWDGMETERKTGRRTWTIYGRVTGAKRD